MKNRINIFVRIIAIALICAGAACLGAGILYHQGNIFPEKFLTEDLGIITVILLTNGIYLLFLSVPTNSSYNKSLDKMITLGYCFVIIVITMSYLTYYISIIAMASMTLPLICIFLFSWREEISRSRAKFWEIIDTIARRFENA